MQAVTMSPIDPAATLRAATVAHEAGRLDEAESLYRACLAAQPAEAQALHGLGWLCVQRGDWPQALRCFRQALGITPWEPELWISQLEALMQLDQVEAVHQLLHRARASGLDATRVAAFEARLHERRVTYLADAVKAAGKTAQQAMQPPERELLELRQAFLDRRFDDARQKARHLLKRYPLAAFGWRVMALVTPVADDPDFAMLSRRLACELDPEGVDAAMNLALALHELNRYDEAEALYRDVLARQPDNLRALVNLGLLQNVRSDPAALDTLRRARASGSDDYRVALALGGYLRDHDQPEEAIPLLEEALAKQPESQMAAAALSVCYLAVGRHEDAAALFRRATASPHVDLAALDITLFVGTHLASISAAELAAMHRQFGTLLEDAVPEPSPHPNTRDERRRLRVGIVSGDLRQHAMAYFLIPFLRALDRGQIEVVAFSNHAVKDHVTAAMRPLFEDWHDVEGLGDEAFADCIRGTRIDVLIDLSGHTGQHRLRVFAMKPAPIQISWAGYPATTGLTRMDYYLADTAFATPGLLDDQFTERLMLTEAGCTFQIMDDVPDVAPLPSLSGHPFTFGSFNRISKVGPESVRLWANVLAAVPASRLAVGALTGNDQQRLTDALAAHGVDHRRLMFFPRMGLRDYLDAHRHIDLLLDTTPYAGGTTTCHGVVMGVPTLTLAGRTLPGRQGVSVLGRLGLNAFIASSESEFVHCATRWSSNPEELATIRQGMRQRIAASPIGNPKVMAEAFEDGLRRAWIRWCRGEAPAALVIPRRQA